VDDGLSLTFGRSGYCLDREILAYKQEMDRKAVEGVKTWKFYLSRKNGCRAERCQRAGQQGSNADWKPEHLFAGYNTVELNRHRRRTVVAIRIVGKTHHSGHALKAAASCQVRRHEDI